MSLRLTAVHAMATNIRALQNIETSNTIYHPVTGTEVDRHGAQARTVGEIRRTAEMNIKAVEAMSLVLVSQANNRPLLSRQRNQKNGRPNASSLTMQQSHLLQTQLQQQIPNHKLSQSLSTRRQRSNVEERNGKQKEKRC